MKTTVTIDNVDTSAILDALLAIERARSQGMYDTEQIQRLTPIVLNLREAMDEALGLDPLTQAPKPHTPHHSTP